MWPEGQPKQLESRMSSGLQGAEHQCPACGSAGGTKRGPRTTTTLFPADVAGLYTPLAIAHALDRATATRTTTITKNLSVPDFIDRRLDEIVAGFDALPTDGPAVGYRVRSGIAVASGSARRLDRVRRGGFTNGCRACQAPRLRCLLRRADGRALPRGLFRRGDGERGAGACTRTAPLDSRDCAGQSARAAFSGLTTPHGRGVSSKALGLKWSVFTPPEHLQLFSIGGIEPCSRMPAFVKCVSQRTASTRLNSYPR